MGAAGAWQGCGQLPEEAQEGRAEVQGRAQCPWDEERGLESGRGSLIFHHPPRCTSVLPLSPASQTLGFLLPWAHFPIVFPLLFISVREQSCVCHPRCKHTSQTPCPLSVYKENVCIYRLFHGFPILPVNKVCLPLGLLYNFYCFLKIHISFICL